MRPSVETKNTIKSNTERGKEGRKDVSKKKRKEENKSVQGKRKERKEIVTRLHYLHVDNLVFFLQKKKTVGCPPGFFLDASINHCRECDVGSYQDTEGQVTCQSCPPGYTTKSKNSDSVDDCYRIREVGKEGTRIAETNKQ